MEPERPLPRPAVMTELEAKLLAGAVGARLFKRPAEPVQLGRYQILGRIGQGGMSVVFRAHDPQLRREVAVKLLHPSREAPDQEQRARLQREALALGRLSHPNVVQVFEIGEAQGQVFVAMELVRGSTLRAWLAERPRAPSEVLAVLGQAGRGLAAAHAVGIIHRDFKPENVLVGEDGRVRVVDFGLARAAEAPLTAGPLAPLTKSGAILGTPAFMAPEQFASPARASARSDQFSFAVVAYEALYGERPFADPAALAAGEVRAPPAGSQVPPAIRAALLRGLDPDPERRWGSIDALLAELERTATRDPAEPTPTPRAPRRRWKPWALAAGVTLALGTLGLGLAWRGPGPAVPADALAEELQARLAEGDLAGAERTLARSLAAGPIDRQTEAALWIRLARMLAREGTQAPREAWARALVRAEDPVLRKEALLGLARAAAPEELGPALALAEAEGAAVWDAPELAPLRASRASREAPAAEHAALAEQVEADLAETDAPRGTLALVRVGLLELAATTLLDHGERTDSKARRRIALAAGRLLGAARREEAALQALTRAASEEALRAAADAERAALLLRGGRVAEALEAATGEGRDAAAALLKTRTELGLRLSEGAEPRTLDPAMLRGERATGTLRVVAEPGPLVAWAFAAEGERLLVGVTVEVLAGAGELALRASGATGDAGLGLRVEDGRAALRCGGAEVGALPRRELVTLQLDLAGGSLACRARGEDGRLLAEGRAALANPWTRGAIQVELRGADQPASSDALEVRVRKVEVIGGTPARPATTDPLGEAGALLACGDARAAAALAAIDHPRARAWRAIALLREGEWEAARPLLVGADEREELTRWIRADPALTPALRQALGEAAFLELFARAWELAAPRLGRRAAQAVLAALDGLDARCEVGAVCAELQRALGRALEAVGERGSARRAYAAALASAKADGSARVPAGELLLDLARVGPE